MKESGNIQEMLIRTLESSHLFRKVSPEMMKELASKMVVAHHQAGETIIRKDDVGITMYFIISGEVKIHDREHLLAKLGVGEFFGEMSILDREPRSMSVTATQPTSTGSIERQDLFEVINRFPGMTVELIAFLSRRLRTLNRFMVEQLKNREKELEQQVAQRTSDLEKKNLELEEAILKIRESQHQLIMQEKLASLGSLTAGVAHELHNPLNFVNNFTELSLELLEEMSVSGNPEMISEAIIHLRKNLQKILHHGHRAEDIIRAMIMHSNTSSGNRVLTDINSICEQSTNMVSYTVGNMATGCTVIFEKILDPSVPAASVIPRDISKALINLINNAYWEVDRKWHELPESFTPKIIIRTSADSQNIHIEILDNGEGVNEDLTHKIFEPFFTTKPTGQGVGLGLSISNDIVRAHGGQITLSRITDPTSQEMLTVFKITLPA